MIIRDAILNRDFNTFKYHAQARRQKKLQHPEIPVENVALTTKGLQEIKTTIEWDDDGKIGNKNKL